MYRLAARRVELALLVPVLLLVPLGVVVTNIAQSGTVELRPMAVAVAFVSLIAAAWPSPGRVIGATSCSCPRPRPSGHRVVMLNRLPQDLAGNPALNLGMVGTQLVWFAVGLAAMVAVAVGLRDDGFLRHYKYTWGLAAALLLVITFLFGTEINDARLWIVVGPLGSSRPRRSRSCS